MRSSTVPARGSQSRSREPLRWLRRSALGPPCPAPHRASLSNSIRRCAAKPIISRRNVVSEPFSRSVRRAILSSVIVVILGSEFGVATHPYSGPPRCPLTGPPAPDSWRSLRRAGQRPPTPSPGTRPVVNVRLFANSGTDDHRMPIYHVLVGVHGDRKSIPVRRLPL